MKESERLRAAKALIADEKNWMQGDYSDKVDLSTVGACAFCSLGAVLKARGENLRSPDINSTSFYLTDVLEAGGYEQGVAEYNDTHSHEEVMLMFDKAIQLAQSEGN